ncbi:MAG: thiamine pyrophosphate-dependent enzyme, partial [Enterobacteriaceae bacterium]
EKLKAPVAHTSRAKDFIEHDNPYNVGMTGMIGMASGFQMIKQCDTLLLLGVDFAWSQFYPTDATIIQIDIKAEHLGRRTPITFGAVGDIKLTLNALLPLLSARDDDKFLTHFVTLHQKSQHTLDKKAHATASGRIHPQYLVELLDRYAAEDAIVTADGGTAMVWLLRHFNTNGKRRTLSSLKHGTMANSMPQALGLQKAFPKRQVIALCGDGGITMLFGDLLTAVQEQIPVKLIVLNNGTLGFVELEQKVEGLLSNYTGLNNPNFAKIAEVMGLYSQRVTDSADLEQAIQNLLAAEGPALLDVLTCRQELVMPPTVEVEQVLGMALYTAKAILSGHQKELIDLIDTNLND